MTHSWRLVPLLALVGGCRPAVTPLPEPAPVTAPVVRPAERVVPRRASLALRHETVRYTVTSRSTLTQDSAGTPITEQVDGSAVVALALERTGDPTLASPLGLRGTGRVERFVLSPTTRLAVAQPSAARSPGYPTLPLTVPFEALVAGTTARVSLTPPLANECDRPETGATAMARELLVRLPGALEAGSAWADTARVFVCRGGVPITVQTIVSTRVTAFDPSPEGTAGRVRLERELVIRAEGEQVSAWRTVTVSGRGQGRQQVVVSVPEGVIQTLSSESETTFELRDSARPDGGLQRVTQRATYSARLQPPG